MKISRPTDKDALTTEEAEVKNNPQPKKIDLVYERYKAIALDWIINSYKNIQGIYAKYYPDASEDSLKSEPYRLLDNVRFRQAYDEVKEEIDVKKLNIGKKVILKLFDKMNKATKDSDQINAAVWLGKTEALFKEVLETKDLTKIDKERKDRLFGMVKDLREGEDTN